MLFGRGFGVETGFRKDGFVMKAGFEMREGKEQFLSWGSGTRGDYFGAGGFEFKI